MHGELDLFTAPGNIYPVIKYLRLVSDILVKKFLLFLHLQPFEIRTSSSRLQAGFTREISVGAKGQSHKRLWTDDDVHGRGSLRDDSWEEHSIVFRNVDKAYYDVITSCHLWFNFLTIQEINFRLHMDCKWWQRTTFVVPTPNTVDNVICYT